MQQVIVVFLIISVLAQIMGTADSVSVQDELVLSEQGTLGVGEFWTFNRSCEEGEGYYGHMSSSDGPLLLSVVEQVYLAAFLNGTYEPETEWRDENIWRWEFVCEHTTNYSFVIRLVHGAESSVSFSIYLDLTPVEVHFHAELTSLYLPRFNLSFSFTGGFFVSATIEFPNNGAVNWLEGNESVSWRAYEYDQNLSVYVPYPDGVYNITVRVRERIRERVTAFQIHKHSNQSLGLLLTVMLGLAMISFAIEIWRRRRYDINHGVQAPTRPMTSPDSKWFRASSSAGPS